MSDSALRRHTMPSSRVPSPVTYDLLTPAAPTDGVPLLIWLHGGNGPTGFAELMQPLFDRAWGAGELAPLIVALPHTSRSFWMDGVGDLAGWERMIVTELIPHLRAAHGCGETTAIGGLSMGGLGALRTALRHSERFVAVAALEPALEPTAEWHDVARRDRLYRDDALMAELFGEPVDADRFRDNHPLALVDRLGPEIAANDLAIYVECGDEDALGLQHGAEAIHRRMWDVGLRHEYRSVRGGNHVGRSLPPRIHDALGFIGRALRAPSADPEAEAVVALLVAGQTSVGFRRTSVVDGPTGPIEVHESGDGEPVVLIPSLGRGATDFDDLARRLAAAGYHAIHPEPRGMGGSSGDLAGLSMADLAADVAAVVHACTDRPVTLVGHAFGNRVARMTATEYPHLVDSLVLLCCGGLVPPEPEAAAALHRVFDVELADSDHLAAVDQAFFAPGNDASVWFDGWHGVVAAVQSEATTAQPVEHWWGAGGKDLVVVQPADDVMAVPENALRICEEFGERAQMVTVPNAGHALLPEQPYAVEVALRAWLTRPR